jgi:cytidyltransferase-like protein
VGDLPVHERRGIIGYTAGVFDLFHEGHLHLLRRARARCDHLIVGLSTDEVAREVHGRTPVFPLIERMEIVQSVRFVDHVVPQTTYDKSEAWEYLHFDRLFAGDNLRGSAEWERIERVMTAVGVEVVFLPATRDVSGELLETSLQDVRQVSDAR